MSGPKHTPGPWTLSYDQGSTRDVIAESDNTVVCMVRQSWVDRDAYHANAALIAAAPETAADRDRLREVNADLLGSLKSLRKTVGTLRIEATKIAEVLACLYMADDAIAKAECGAK